MQPKNDRTSGEAGDACEAIYDEVRRVQQEEDRQVSTLTAEVVTGVNRLLGRPLWDVGPPLGSGGFTFVGGINETGGTPVELLRSTPSETVLATTLDDAWLASYGLTRADIDPTLINVPLHCVPVITDAAGTRRTLSSILDAHNADQALAIPHAPITLGDWLNARGRGVFIERADAYPEVILEFDRLIPRAVYTVWALFAVDGALRAVPFGGAPNIVTTDHRGRGAFRRTLSSSPTRMAAGDAPLLFIDVVFHSDRGTYGAVPEVARTGYPAGVVAQTHLAYLVTGRRL